MPGCKDKKKAIPSVFEGIASTTRHKQLHSTIYEIMAAGIIPAAIFVLAKRQTR
jgi:hypothetical protein